MSHHNSYYTSKDVICKWGKEENDLIDYLTKRPMLLCAVISCIGLIVGVYSEYALIGVGIGVIIALFIMMYRKVKPSLLVSLIFVFAIVICASFEMRDINEARYFSGNECSGEYVVVEETELVDDYYQTTVEVIKSEILKKGTKISVTYNEGDLSFSNRFIADISLKSLENSDYKMSNYSEGIYLRGYMKNIEKSGKNDFVLEKIDKLRKYIKSKIFKNYRFVEASTILALVTGDRSYFTDDFYKNVKYAGVAHVMVVSGMHLSVIVSFLLYLSNKFFYNRYLKSLIIFIAVIIVSAACGFTMSIIRAGVTHVLIAISLVFNRPNTPANTLGGAVSMVLLNNPYAIFNVAFQLSVLSTFGILAVAIPCVDFIEEKKYIKNKFWLYLISSVLISVSASVMTAPVVIYYFGYISNVALITNLLVCSVSTVALVLCILGLIFLPLEKVFFFLSSIIIKYINAVINYFGNLPFAITITPAYTVYIAIAVIIIILLGLLACKRRIDMLKLKKIHIKKIKEGGKKVKWQSFMKKH